MCISIYIYIHTCIYKSLSLSIYIYTDIHIYIIYIYMYIYIYIHTYIVLGMSSCVVLVQSTNVGGRARVCVMYFTLHFMPFLMAVPRKPRHAHLHFFYNPAKPSGIHAQMHARIDSFRGKSGLTKSCHESRPNQARHRHLLTGFAGTSDWVALLV